MLYAVCPLSGIVCCVGCAMCRVLCVAWWKCVLCDVFVVCVAYFVCCVSCCVLCGECRMFSVIMWLCVVFCVMCVVCCVLYCCKLYYCIVCIT